MLLLKIFISAWLLLSNFLGLQSDIPHKNHLSRLDKITPDTPLYLKLFTMNDASTRQKDPNWHYSHFSHKSHHSHYSHRSHFSHYSSC